MRKCLLVFLPIVLGALAMAQTAGDAAPEEGGVGFKTIMNVVFGVMALALIGLGIWYFKLKKND